VDSDPQPLFGTLLKEYRVAQRLSQETLAERSGLTREAINLLERGRRLSPRRDTVKLLANGLKLSGDERARLLAAATWRETRPTDAAARSLPSVLPVRLTSFVGRERELGNVQELVLANRVVTLTGTGGIGKTSLALEVAGKVQSRFADGVTFVELSAVGDEELIPQAVAAAVGVRERHGQAILVTLCTALSRTQRLLVLDNCEHVLLSCARIAEALLQRCPGLRLLVTSREALRIGPEIVYRVPPLTLADRETPMDALPGRSEAVRLFAQRAGAARSGFALTSANAPAVADICRCLDGIPLAIELAAARVVALTPEQIVQHLNDRFSLLTVGRRTALPRHRTLRALIDWSYEYLIPAEQGFFRRLAVFVGGFTLEAAAAVCADPGLACLVSEARSSAGLSPGLADQDTILRTNVVDLLVSLVDKSLVIVEEHGGEARYRLLETVREYARERLAGCNEAVSAHQAHASYYRALAAQLHDQLVVSRDLLHGAFPVEMDNLRAAIRWLSDSSDWSGCVELIGSVSDYWHDTGQLGESAPWLALALQHTQDVPAAARCRALLGLGTLAYGRRDYATAESVLAESLQLSRVRSDERATARALTLLGTILEEQRRYGDARLVLDEALRLADSLGDQRMRLRVLFLFGLLANHQGQLDDARAVLNEALEQARRLGSASYHEGVILLTLGVVAMDGGDFAQAHAFYTQSVAQLQQSGYRWALLLVLEMFAVLSARQGHAERSLVQAAAAAAARDGTGSPIPPQSEAMVHQALERARSKLGEAAASAWARGAAMTFEQVLREAMDDDGSRNLDR
jgi:predicted ATPase/transcriptional regulator with XRE-family HTH domain/Tfp pilus assembly protein PilF